MRIADHNNKLMVEISTGSNPLFGALHSTVSIFGKSSEIWVEGEGMLHAIYFTKNSSDTWSVSYVNLYVQSETLKTEKTRQKPCFLPAIMGDSAAIVAAYILNYVKITLHKPNKLYVIFFQTIWNG